MNARSIQKLRKRFIIGAMASVAIVMLFIASTINLVSYYSSRAEIRRVLTYICENEGQLPSEGGQSSREETEDAFDSDLSLFGVFFRSLGNMSGSMREGVRYFAVLYDAEGEVEEIQNHRIPDISETQMERFARVLASRRSAFGSYGVYFYRRQSRPGGEGIVLAAMDCTVQVNIMLRMVYASLIICFAGLLIVFWPVLIISKALVAPEIRNIEKQKQFITNASHELKTPLAVIRANTEIQEMMDGETEWTQSTMRQIDRMDGLIRNLVMISRADEQADRAELSSVNVSAALSETADAFEAVATQDGKKLVRRIDPDILFHTNEAAIRQLASLLLDNAIKYCDEGGEISVQLSKKGRTMRFVISNSFKDGASVDYTRFFDRFYRNDTAHSQEHKGGYGIGLSIAETLVRQYRGDIQASWKDGVISFHVTFTEPFAGPAPKKRSEK